MMKPLFEGAEGRINTKLFREVQMAILLEPRQFYMHSFFHHNDNVPNCGMAACIAGWGIAIDRAMSPQEADQKLGYLLGSRFGERTIEEVAREAFGITPREAEVLFYLHDWPEPYHCDFNYTHYDGPEIKSVIASRRIDHFPETGL